MTAEDIAALTTAEALLAGVLQKGTMNAIDWAKLLARLMKGLQAFCKIAPGLPIPPQWMVWITTVCSIVNKPPAGVDVGPDKPCGC